MSVESASSPAGVLAARTLRVHDVDTVFTLNGAHLWPLYDGCVREGIRLVDTAPRTDSDIRGGGLGQGHPPGGCRRADGGAGRDQRHQCDHERMVQRHAGVRGRRSCAGGSLGSGIATRARSRAARRHGYQARRRQRSRPTTFPEPSTVRCAQARTPHRGPTLVDVPLDCWGPTDATVTGPVGTAEVVGEAADPEAITRVAELLMGSERPVLLIGGDVYWAGAEAEATRARRGRHAPDVCQRHGPRAAPG